MNKSGWHGFAECFGILWIVSSFNLASLAMSGDRPTTRLLAQATPNSCAVDQDALAEATVRELSEQVRQTLRDPSRVSQRDRPIEEAALTMMQALRVVQALSNATVRANLTEELIVSPPAQASLLSQITTQAQAVERLDIVREVLTPARQLVQSLPTGYSAAKVRAFLAIATLHQQTGQLEQTLTSLRQALEASNSIRGGEFKTVALTNIAQGYIAIGQIDTALPLLNQSRQMANTIDHRDPNRKANALAAIATAYATAGEIEPALQTTQSIQTAVYSQSSALRAISDRLVQVSQFDRALLIAETIQTTELRALAFANIAGGLAQAGQAAQANQVFAEAIAQSRTTGDSSAYVMSQVVQHYAQSGQRDAARDVAQRIPDAAIQAQTLMAIAHYYSTANQTDAATDTLKEAIQAIQNIHDASQQSSVFQSVIEDHLRQGHYDLALQVTQTLPTEVAIAPFDKPELIGRVAREAATAGNFDVARQAAEAIDPQFTDYRNQAYQAIALEYAKAEQVDQALQVAESITNDGAYPYRIRTLAAIAGEYLQDRQTAAAEGVLTQAIAQVQPLDDPSTQADGLAAIAIQYANAGQIDRVAALHREVLRLAATLSDSSTNSSVLREIVGQYLNAGQYTAAVEAAEAIRESSDRINTLSHIINRAIQAGSYEAALQATTTLDIPEIQTRFLITLADRYLQTAQPTRATQLLAQAFDIAKRIPGSESKTIVVRMDQDPQGNPIPGLTVDDDNDRGSLLEAIALTYAQARQYNQAVQVARSLQNATTRNQLLQRLACYR
ncbi:MAG: hypothetical protein SFY66_05285 [Oculatellaceae cyanobacterium bins.114]|nr:hypothetical protein [Oculatellaceae cyanobacterium bins.114]